MQILDMRGRACPEPVIKTVALIAGVQKPETVVVQVDNEIAVENLTKMATSKGLKSSSKKVADNHYEVSIEVVEVQSEEDVKEENVVVAVTGNVMGTGEDELGRNLLKGFIYALSSQDIPPAKILFYNTGVRITTEGSASIEDLKVLEKAGAKIYSCGACLNNYGLSEKLSVGEVTNMYDIVSYLMEADLVIRP